MAETPLTVRELAYFLSLVEDKDMRVEAWGCCNNCLQRFYAVSVDTTYEEAIVLLDPEEPRDD
jgi:hypothetical protein